MTLTLERRGFLKGLGAIIAAPAIVRASSIMPVKGWMTIREAEEAEAIKRLTLMDWAKLVDPALVSLAPFFAETNAIMDAIPFAPGSLHIIPGPFRPLEMSPCLTR